MTENKEQHIDETFSNSHTTTKEKKSRFPSWLKLTLVFVMVLALIFGTIIFTLDNTNKKVVEQATAFTKNMVNNDAAKAYGLTSKGFQSGASKEQLATYFNQLYQSIGAGKIIFQDKQVETSNNNGNNGVVVFKIDKSGKIYYVRIMLIKESGGWKVINFAVNQKKLEANIR